jgi:hypothetical protein
MLNRALNMIDYVRVREARTICVSELCVSGGGQVVRARGVAR